jgi:hypothetical protein
LSSGAALVTATPMLLAAKLHSWCTLSPTTGQVFTESGGRGTASCPASTCETSEPMPLTMPNASHVTGPTTTIRLTRVTSAAAMRGLTCRLSHS